MKVKVKFTDQPYGFDSRDNCYIRALQSLFDVEISDDPDLIFYSCFGTDFLAYPDSVRIFLANEPVLPNFNDCDYAIGAMDLTFGTRYFRQPPLLNYGETAWWEHIDGERTVPPDAFGRKFCNFIYANETGGSGAALRKEFCMRLAEYRSVDCPGRVLNNMPDALEKRYPNGKLRTREDLNASWAEEKLAFLRNYKFTIAFENTELPGFTTEKLIHPLMAGSVPIYWGNPQAAEYFNPKAFINCADYGSDLDAVIRRVEELDRDEEQYMEMLRQPPLSEGFPFGWEEELKAFLARIVEGGCVPLDKNPMGFDAMSAQSFGAMCREGKYGMRDIVRRSADALSGWLSYKIKRQRRK